MCAFGILVERGATRHPTIMNLFDENQPEHCGKIASPHACSEQQLSKCAALLPPCEWIVNDHAFNPLFIAMMMRHPHMSNIVDLKEQLRDASGARNLSNADTPTTIIFHRINWLTCLLPSLEARNMGSSNELWEDIIKDVLKSFEWRSVKDSLHPNAFASQSRHCWENFFHVMETNAASKHGNYENCSDPTVSHDVVQQECVRRQNVLNEFETTRRNDLQLAARCIRRHPTDWTFCYNLLQDGVFFLHSIQIIVLLQQERT